MEYNTTNNTILPAEPSAASVPDNPGQDWRRAVDLFLRTHADCPATQRTYRIALRQFFTWVEGSGRRVELLTRVDVSEFKASLLDPAHRRSVNTANGYLSALRSFYRWASADGAVQDITRGVRSVKVTHDGVRQGAGGFRKAALEEDEAAALLEHFRTYTPARINSPGYDPARHLPFRNEEQEALRNYAMVNLMLRCGLRGIEVTRATVGDITYRAGSRVLNVWGKGHHAPDSYVALTDAAYGPIRDYLGTRPRALDSEPLFTCVGLGSEGRALTVRTIQGLVKEGLKAIGVNSRQKTTHSLRHTTGTMLIRRGATLVEAQAVMRHSSPTTTQIYVNEEYERQLLKNPAERLLDDCFKI